MHATACQCVWLLVAQVAAGQLTPIDNVQLQPIPMSVELNAPSASPATVPSRNPRTLVAPATPIDEPGAFPPEAKPTTSVLRNRDRFAVAQVSHDQQVIPVDHEGDRSSSAALIRLSLTPLGNENLPGRPMSLLSAIERAEDRGTQLAIIKAYWRASARLAEYHWAVKQVAFLASLPQPRNAIEHAALQAVREDAKADEHDARLAVTQAQFELADAARISVTREAPPIPQDPPFVGQYRTNFQAIFASRTPNSTATRLANTIPIAYEAIESRAIAAAAAFDSMQAMEDAYGKGQATLADVLRLFDRLNRQRQAFVSGVRDYNFAIAEYSLTVIDPGVSRQVIVATLIRTTPQNRAAVPVARAPSRASFNDVQPRRSTSFSDAAPMQNRPQARITSNDEQGAPLLMDRSPPGQWRQSPIQQEIPPQQAPPQDEPPPPISSRLSSGNSGGGGAFLQSPAMNNDASPSPFQSQSPLDNEQPTNPPTIQPTFPLNP